MPRETARSTANQRANGSLVPQKSVDALGRRGIAACTEEMIEKLCAGISQHPSLATTCRAAGISPRVVQEWVRRGSMYGANPVLAEFTERFLKADADHAKDLYSTALELVAGEEAPYDPEDVDVWTKKQAINLKRADILMKEVHTRYRVHDDISAFLDQARKRTDDIHELFCNPTPKIRHALERAGWVHRSAIVTEGVTVGDVLSRSDVEAEGEVVE